MALGALFVLWQVPALAINSELWRRFPWLIAAFTAWCAWTAWEAMCGREATTDTDGTA